MVGHGSVPGPGHAEISVIDSELLTAYRRGKGMTGQLRYTWTEACAGICKSEKGEWFCHWMQLASVQNLEWVMVVNLGTGGRSLAFESRLCHSWARSSWTSHFIPPIPRFSSARWGLDSAHCCHFLPGGPLLVSALRSLWHTLATGSWAAASQASICCAQLQHPSLTVSTGDG